MIVPPSTTVIPIEASRARQADPGLLGHTFRCDAHPPCSNCFLGDQCSINMLAPAPEQPDRVNRSVTSAGIILWRANYELSSPRLTCNFGLYWRAGCR